MRGRERETIKPVYTNHFHLEATSRNRIHLLTGFEDAHRSGNRDRVEIFEANFGDHILVRFQRDFEYVSLLGLRQKEEHGLGLVRGAADEDHAALGVVQVVTPARNRRPDIRLIAEVLVRDVIFGTNQHARGTVVSAFEIR